GDATHSAGSASAILTIDKAPSVTVVTVGNATYDGSPHGGTADVSGAGGLSQSLTVNYVGINGTIYGPSAFAPTNAGSYVASTSYGGDVNHLPSSDNEPFAIAKVDAVVAISGYRVLYDGQPHTATVDAIGVNGEDLSALLDVSRTTHT